MAPTSPIQHITNELPADAEVLRNCFLRVTSFCHRKYRQNAFFTETRLAIALTSIMRAMAKRICEIFFLGRPSKIPRMIVVSAPIAMRDDMLFAWRISMKCQGNQTMNWDRFGPIVTPKVNA
jgi:hypothetical protein